MTEAQTQQTAITASGRTGETCQKSGPYKCSTTPVVTVYINKNDRFPPGPSSNSNAGQTTTWTMLSPTTTSSE